MRRTPPILLLLIVVGLPSVVVMAMLWPKIQNRIFDNPVNDAPAVVRSHEEGGFNEAVPNVEVGEAGQDSARVSKQESTTELSAVEKAVAANRKKLQAAKESYEQLVQAIDPELLKTYGANEWHQVQALTSQAHQLSQPTSAIAKYSEAEALLRALKADLSNRELIAELSELQSRSQPLLFLAKLAEVSTSHPEMQQRFAPFWVDVSRWDADTWLAVIQRECERLSPVDGGFAEVYHALADFYRDAGREQAAIDAEQTAWNNALRMTSAKRAAESSIQSLQRLADSTPTSTRISRVEQATNLVRDVADVHDRIKLLADVASLSPQPEIEKLLEEIHNLADESRIDLRLYWPAIYKCKILAETSHASDVLEVCRSIPKYNGRIGAEPFAANTMGYAHAASAAARAGQQAEFWQAILLAEAQQLDSTGIGLRDQRASAALAFADLRKRNFRRAVFSAMNLREYSLRPPLLFAVMRGAPQDIPAPVAKPLIQQHGSDDLGCVAVAAYFPTLAASFDSEPQAISWILGLKTRSVRIAALIGYIRHKTTSANADQSQLNQPLPLDTTDARSLLENASAEVAILQQPLERAWAHLWIAACWNQLNQPASYDNALAKFDDAIYAAWRSLWQNNDYHRRGDANTQREQQLKQLIECYCIAAELQAFVLEDPRRAIENVINAARASQPLNDSNSNLKIRLWMITEAIHRECDIPFGTLESVFLPPNNYYRMLLGAREGKHTEVAAMVRKIESEGLGPNYKAPDFLARAYAELAISSAASGDLATYRSARRKAASIVTSQGADESIMLPLHEADALAGEFTLAMEDIRRYSPLALYGTAGRTASVLCSELSLASRTEDALENLPPASQPFYRLQAMHAVAASRSSTMTSERLDRWLDEQSEQLDLIAILCGMACKKPIQH